MLVNQYCQTFVFTLDSRHLLSSNRRLMFLVASILISLCDCVCQSQKLYCIFPATISEVTKIKQSESFYELTYTWLFMKYNGAHSCGNVLEHPRTISTLTWDMRAYSFNKSLKPKHFLCAYVFPDLQTKTQGFRYNILEFPWLNKALWDIFWKNIFEMGCFSTANCAPHPIP